MSDLEGSYRALPAQEWRQPALRTSHYDRVYPEVSLGQFRIGRIDVVAERPPHQPTVHLGVTLRGLCDVRDPAMPETRTYLQKYIPFDHWERMSEVARARTIRSLVLEAVTHEVDEWLRINGQRVVDPHAEGR